MSLHLFDAFGIELEYMIVDQTTLNIRPVSDFILKDEQGNPVSDLEFGSIAWSNELTHHVIELKTNGPTTTLSGLDVEFQQNVNEINRQLNAIGSRLLPTAMHPWMAPDLEMQLWPHEYHAVYETFDKIFNCKGHGWANLQSMHINLPFDGDEEFGRLHAAIRLLLPLLPGLACSSPIYDGQLSQFKDSRLEVYRHNSKRIPEVAGRVIPEQAFDFASYQREIFNPIDAAIAPYDPNHHLQHEFLNARGAIARFSRGAIEIRVIDVQECPKADLAIAALVVEVLKLLVKETWGSLDSQQALTIDELEAPLIATIQNGEQAVITSRNLLIQLGILRTACSAGEIWQHLYEVAIRENPALEQEHGDALKVLLQQGTLSTRILSRLEGETDSCLIKTVYTELADCLSAGRLFQAAPR